MAPREPLTAPAADAPPVADGAPLVSVVIPCYQQGRFLAEAVRSVLAQDDPHCELVVVDDGSTDDTAAVAAGFPEVRYLRQENAGPSAARNAGLRASRGGYVVFLDADDRLVPGALAHGRRALAENPSCAFVSGHFRLVAEDGDPLAEPRFTPIRGGGYLQLLRGNYVGMLGTVMYRRAAVEEAGGFDPALRSCEDYDLYLRIARRHPVAQHRHVVAEYRHHGANNSSDPAGMLRTALAVLRRQHRASAADPEAGAAFREGEHAFRSYYAERGREAVRTHLERGEWRMALGTFAGMAHAGGARVLPLLLSQTQPHRLWRRLRRRFARPPRVGRVRMGDLRRVTPISRSFGYDRGRPVDRFYIERFLAWNAADVRGRVLEIGDASYTLAFGGERVERADVLHVHEGNPAATFVGDLTDAPGVPSDAFDCVILTQTLQLVFDVPAALRTAHRILKPGGVLLVTVPGMSQTGDPAWRDTWYWSFTPASVTRLLEEAFPGGSTEVAAFGNVLAASAFLYGLAEEELRPAELEASDPDYPLLITARAAKARAAG